MIVVRYQQYLGYTIWFTRQWRFLCSLESISESAHAQFICLHDDFSEIIGVFVKWYIVEITCEVRTKYLQL